MTTVAMLQSIQGRGWPSARDHAGLVVSGRLHEGWTRLEVSRSLEEAAASFGFECTVKYPADASPIDIKPGDASQVSLGGDMVADGYIDAVTQSYSAMSHVVQVTGRSKTGQLVDCSAVDAGPAFRTKTVLQIARALAAPYSVDVVADVDVGEPIARFVLEPGETVHAAVERLARLRQLIVTDDEEGQLVFTRAARASAKGALVAEPQNAALRILPRLSRRSNVLSAEVRYDVSERYSEYRCRGQAVADDETNGLGAAQSDGTETDDGLDLRRVLVLSAEGPADPATCKARATWEAAVRAGKSVTYKCEVQGWRQTEDGDLWKPNLLVQIDDEMLGFSAELLIVSCAYSLDESGTKCRLTCAPRIRFLAEPPRKASRTGASAAVGIFQEVAPARATSTRPVGG